MLKFRLPKIDSERSDKYLFILFLNIIFLLYGILGRNLLVPYTDLSMIFFYILGILKQANPWILINYCLLISLIGDPNLIISILSLIFTYQFATNHKIGANSKYSFFIPLALIILGTILVKISYILAVFSAFPSMNKLLLQSAEILITIYSIAILFSRNRI